VREVSLPLARSTTDWNDAPRAPLLLRSGYFNPLAIRWHGHNSLPASLVALGSSSTQRTVLWRTKLPPHSQVASALPSPAVSHFGQMVVLFACSNSRPLSRRNSQYATGKPAKAKMGKRLQKLPLATLSCAMTPARPPAIHPPASIAVMPSHESPAMSQPWDRDSRAVAACHFVTSSGVRGVHIRVMPPHAEN
jgi:hypothetical protein